MDLQIERFALGPLQTNSYVLQSRGECVVVDPGVGPAPLIRYLESANLVPKSIWLTHGHGDHIGGILPLREAFGEVAVCCPAADAHMLTSPEANMSAPFGFPLAARPADRLLEPGTAAMIGQASWQILDTSGHTPGGVSFYCPGAAVVLTGDALFAGSIGRTDIPGADSARLLENIRRELLVLPEETRVLPGHGPETTIGRERRSNPFLLGRHGGEDGGPCD